MAIKFDTIDNLRAFLAAAVPESVALDYKEDFPAALEKTISAMANTYGGYVILGVAENKDTSPVNPAQGVKFEKGIGERVLSICLDAIYPPVFPEVAVFPFKSEELLEAADRALVVIQVHESDQAHSIKQRTGVYVRSGPVSKALDRRANLGEIEWLLEKRSRAEKAKADLMGSVGARAAALRRFRNKANYGLMVATTSPSFLRNPLFTREQLSEIFLRAKQVSVAAHRFPPVDHPVPTASGVRTPNTQRTFFSFAEITQEGLFHAELEMNWQAMPEHAFAIYEGAVLAFLAASLRFALDALAAAGFGGVIEHTVRISPTIGLTLRNSEGMMGIETLSTECPDSEVFIRLKGTVAHLKGEFEAVVTEGAAQLLNSFGVPADMAESFAQRALKAVAR